MAGVSAAWDPDGREARVFGAQTSGVVFLYDTHGELLFEGGITGSRGHAGENFGADRLAAALRSGRPGAGTPSPVFGCSLTGSART
jgi:hypothetical protein